MRRTRFLQASVVLALLAFVSRADAQQPAGAGAEAPAAEAPSAAPEPAAEAPSAAPAPEPAAPAEAPAEPATPSEPAQAEPAAPAEPTTPVEPAAPAEPATPAEPTTPDEPATSDAVENPPAEETPAENPAAERTPRATSDRANTDQPEAADRDEGDRRSFNRSEDANRKGTQTRIESSRDLGLSFSEGERVTIREVNRDSFAFRAGFRVGDVVVSIGDHRLRSHRDFDVYLRRVDFVERVPFHVIRGGRETVVYVQPVVIREAAPARRAANKQVKIGDNSFSPQQLRVTVGTRIVWLNEGQHEHTVTDLEGRFDSGELYPGEDFSMRFRRPGLYTYQCENHPDEMQGTIEVVDPAAPQGEAIEYRSSDVNVDRRNVGDVDVQGEVRIDEGDAGVRVRVDGDNDNDDDDRPRGLLRGGILGGGR